MTRTLTITYDKSNEGVPVMCVAESNIFSIAVVKIFTGEIAEKLFKELTGQNVITKVDSSITRRVSDGFLNMKGDENG